MARGDVRCQVAQIDEVLDTLDERDFLLALDCVTDPRTLGACPRVAYAAGLHAIIVTKDRSAGMTDVVL